MRPLATSLLAACCDVDVMDRDCCLVGCLTLSDCKLAVSDQCRHSPTECATGIHSVISDEPCVVGWSRV